MFFVLFLPGLVNGCFISIYCTTVRVEGAYFCTYTSPEILQELQNKLENKFEFPRDDVVRWLSRIEEAVTVIRPRQKVDLLTERDPDDNKILECALEAKADLIITADLDLLDLKEFHNTKIMHTSSVKYLFGGAYRIRTDDLFNAIEAR